MPLSETDTTYKPDANEPSGDVLATAPPLRTIPLTKGYVALVSPEDYDHLTAHRWAAYIDRRKHSFAVYARRNTTVNGKPVTIQMHRVILGCSGLIDHRDGNGLNNQRNNLRPATQTQNSANAKKWHRKTSSRFKGVSWDKHENKWRAYIKRGALWRHIGYFKEQEDAATAYNFAAYELFGEFARFNKASGEAA